MTDLAVSTRTVLEAGRLVRSFLGRDVGLPVAIAQLEVAVDEQETGARSVRSFGFGSVDEAADATPDATRHDVLLAIEADLDIAGLLLAAGHVTGDGVAPPGDPAPLDRALVQLENTTRTLAGAGGPGRFGFGEPLEAEPEPASPDVIAAADRLRTRAAEVMATLHRETEQVAARIASAVRELAPEKVTEALRRLGEAVPALPKVGRLIRRGIGRLESALQALGRVLHVDLVGKAKAWVAEFWSSVQQGVVLRPVLKRFFGQAETDALVDEVLSRPSDLSSLDAASSALSSLVLGFSDLAQTLRSYVGLIAKVSAALLLASQLFPVLQPWIVPTAALAYMLVLGTALIIGMDYADTGIDRGGIVGVRQVLEGVGE